MDILVAETDTDLAAGCWRFLGSHGFAVTIAARGTDCLAVLQHWFPAVLTLDLDLPWGGAQGVLVHLRSQRSRQRPPAVILTGHVPEEQLPADLLEAPVVRYLCKPFALGELLETVRGCMPGAREEAIAPR
jgi:DNA-binding response OmpR family regulator